LSTRSDIVPNTSINRRALLARCALVADPLVTQSGGEIASVLVQVRPEQLDQVEAAIAAISGCEVHGRDPRGKLVIVVEALDASALGSTLNRIALLPHVCSASLVFHAIDAL
jgi:nitrate reductase NapD